MKRRLLLFVRRIPFLVLAFLGSVLLVAFLVSQPPVALACIVAALLVLTLARPEFGWLVVIALAPFGDLIGRLTALPFREFLQRPPGSPVPSTEPIVLAFLVGWFVREALRRADETLLPTSAPRSTHVALALAGLFALAVTASMAVQLLIQQVTSAFVPEFLRMVWYYLWHDYYLVPRAFPTIPGAATMLEGVGLFCVTTVLAVRVRFVRPGAEVFALAAATVAVINLGVMPHQRPPVGVEARRPNVASALAPDSDRAVRPNTVKNSGFEYGDMTGWEKYDLANEATAGIAGVSSSFEGIHCYYIEWRGPSTNTKGVLAYPGTHEAWQPHHTYVLSFYAKVATSPSAPISMSLQWNKAPEAGGGSVTSITNPSLTTSYQRYAFRVQWGSVVESAYEGGFYISIAPPFTTGPNTLYLDGIQIERGQLLSAYLPVANDPPAPTLRDTLAFRISYVFPDVNAAGSYFALALFVSGGLATAARRRRWQWRVVALLTFLGVMLAGSRTAFAAAWMAAAFLALAVRRRNRAAMRMFLPAILALGVLAAAYAAWSPRSNPLDMETGVRWRKEMLVTSLRVAREYPVFGVGAGRFYEGSARFRPGEWVAGTQRENAHNNFLQVLAELGAVGLILLIGLLGVIFRRSWPLIAGPGDAWVAGLAGGLVAFVATWATGHPLLVREVSLAFWVALGLLGGAAAAEPGKAADTTAGRAARRKAWLPYAIVALVIVALVPVMADRRLARADLSREGQGFSQWHRAPDGVRFRWMLKRAVLYVPASAKEVAIGFRSPGGLATVRVTVEGKQEAQVVVGDQRWEEVRIAVPADSRWASVAVSLQVRGTGPTGAALPDPAAERRIQVSLHQVLSTRPSTTP